MFVPGVGCSWLMADGEQPGHSLSPVVLSFVGGEKKEKMTRLRFKPWMEACGEGFW